MPSYSIRNVALDPNDVTRTFLWDVLIDETSSIDRDEHDRRSLTFAFIVARDLFGFTEPEETFQRYLREAPAPTDATVNRPQTWHDRCMLTYYYCWLIPMLDEQMRKGLQARYESHVIYVDDQLEYAIQLITPVIVNFWRHKSLNNIEKKCMQRVNAIVEGIPNKAPSDIDWNTMSQLGRERLVALTDRIRRRLEREQEWLMSAQNDEDKIPLRRRRKRKAKEVGDGTGPEGQLGDAGDAGDDMYDDGPETPTSEKKIVTTLSARIGSGSPVAEEPTSEAKFRTVKFSM